MSGGVDSSVAALLTLRAGKACLGVTLRLSDDSDEAKAATGRCCAARDVRDARRVAAGLGIPHHVVDMRELFARRVIDPFVDSYLAGRTPVPCMSCNESVKFDDLLDRARALGAAVLVTGHHARVRHEGGRFQLLRAADRAKDQSWFLHGLSQAQLAAVKFPVGEMDKAAVRQLAQEAGMHVAAKPDSQEICFVPDGDTAGFVAAEAVRRGLDVRPGPVVDRDGTLLGEHAGVHGFTVGQRRGLGAHGRPVYAIELRADSATVVAGDAADLACDSCVVDRFQWVAGDPPAGGSVEAEVQVRHGRGAVPALVRARSDGGADVMFRVPPRSVAPGQHAVAYLGDQVLGGGMIVATQAATGSHAASAAGGGHAASAAGGGHGAS